MLPLQELTANMCPSDKLLSVHELVFCTDQDHNNTIICQFSFTFFSFHIELYLENQVRRGRNYKNIQEQKTNKYVVLTFIEAQIASRLTITMPSTSSLHKRNVSSPTALTATPSANPPTCSSVTLLPWHKDKAIAFASDGSTPIIFTCQKNCCKVYKKQLSP